MFKSNLIKFTFLSLLSLILAGSLSANAEVFLFSSKPYDGYRDKFAFQVNAGDTINEKLEIVSNSENDETLKLSLHDAVVNNDGVLGPDLSNVQTTSTGKWVNLSTNNIIIPAKKSAQIDFTATVPKDTPSGEYLAYVVAEPVVDAKNQTGAVGISINKSIKLFFQVKNDFNLSLKLNNLNIIDPKDQSFASDIDKLKYLGKQNMVASFSAENTGNIFGRIDGAYTVTQNNKEVKKAQFSFDITPNIPQHNFYLITNLPYSTGLTKLSLNYKIVPQNLKPEDVKFSNDQGEISDSVNLDQSDLDNFVNSQFPAVQTEDRRLEILGTDSPKNDSTNTEQIRNKNIWVYIGGFLITILVVFIGLAFYIKKNNPEKWDQYIKSITANYKKFLVKVRLSGSRKKVSKSEEDEAGKDYK